MVDKNVLVLGAGMAGVVAARELVRSGAKVTLVERNHRLGGLQYSVECEGRLFDIGPFLFSSSHQMFRSFPFLRDRFVAANHNPVSITSKGRAVRYPCTFRGYARDHGWHQLAYSGLETLYSRVRYRSPTNIPEYARYFMGDSFYRKSGLKNYIERFYCLPDTQIGIEFAEQRLSALLKYTPSALAGKLAQRVVAPWRNSATEAVFVRPPEGFGSMYDAIEGDLQQRGVDVRRACTVSSLRREGSRFAAHFDGQAPGEFDRVVSTIPIPAVLSALGEQPGKGFDHVNLLSLFYRGNVHHDSWVQANFSGYGSWKKVTVFSKCYGKVDGEDYFTVELTTRDSSEAAVVRERKAFEDSAARVGLFDGPIHALGHHITRRAYPVFRAGQSTTVQRDRERVAESGVAIVGRQGNFEYSPSGLVAHRAAELVRSLE